MAKGQVVHRVFANITPVDSDPIQFQNIVLTPLELGLKVTVMNDNLDNRELAHRIDLLEAKMETMNERYDKGWMALRKEMSDNNTKLVMMITGLIVAATTILIGAIALL